MGNKLLDSDELHLFLHLGSIRIDNNEYLESLDNAIKYIFCTGKKMCKCAIYFDLKRYLRS